MAEPVGENGKSCFDETAVYREEYLDKLRRGRRRKGLKILLIVLFVLALPVGFWISEDIRWTRRLEERLNEYRAMGQLVMIEDFAPPSIPDSENAVLLYKKAFCLLKLTKQQQDFIENPSPIKNAAEMDLIKNALAANLETLQLLRQARPMTSYDLGIKYRSPTIDILLPPLNNSRKLGKLMRSVAIYYHNTKNDSAAVETIRDMLPLASSNREAFIIGNLVATAIDSLTCNTVETIAKGLTVTAGSDATAAGGHQNPAGRKAVESLIRELLDEKQARDGWVRAFYAERICSLDMYQCWLNGAFSAKDFFGSAAVSGRVHAVVFRPWHKRAMLGLLKDLSLMAEAAGQANFSGAKQLLPPDPSMVEKDFTDGLLVNIRELLTPALGRAIVLYFRSLGQRRMAAVALAIRLYEIDHGKRPAKLAELVPKYLQAIPADPFSPQDKPIGYRPDLARPILYSLNDNQTDQCGQYSESPDEVPNTDEYDLVFFLNGDRPQPRREKK